MVSIIHQLSSWSQMQPTQSQPSEGRRLKLSPVCTNCREKHLRCDGPPQCTRCKRNGAECVFVPSRRGMRPNKTPSTRALSGLLDETLFPAASGSSAISSISSSPSPHHTAQTGATEARRTSSARQVFELPEAQASRSDSAIPSARLVDLFYSRFLPAQHFVVPKQLLLERQGNPAIYFLRQVIEYIGSNYCSPTSAPLYRVSDPTTISQRLPNNAYTVQALLVLALWFETVHQPAQYVRHLHQARDCALAIGMNHVEYATTNSEGSQQLEQSWSTTWQAVVRMCQPGSFTADQQLNLPIEGQTTTRRMTAPLPMAIEPQSWDWAETYAGQSAYQNYQLMDPAQLSTQTHAHSMPAIYNTSTTMPTHGNLAFRDLSLTTTTWEDIPATVITAPGSDATPWEP